MPVRALLYTWPKCSFCARARDLLERYGVAIDERVLGPDRRELRALQERYGKRTMPFVFLDGEFVGGLAEIEELATSEWGEPQ